MAFAYLLIAEDDVDETKKQPPVEIVYVSGAAKTQSPRSLRKGMTYFIMTVIRLKNAQNK